MVTPIFPYPMHSSSHTRMAVYVVRYFPKVVDQHLHVIIRTEEAVQIQLQVKDFFQRIWLSQDAWIQAGEHAIVLKLDFLPTGMYWIEWPADDMPRIEFLKA